MAYPKPAKSATSAYAMLPAHAPPGGNNLPPSSGEVLLYDADRLESVNVIEAHQSTLGCVSINNMGTMLATASEKGTVIRIFSIPDGQRLYHFRRGSLPAQIYCMSFNATSSLLCVSSATETIHIFKLAQQTSIFRRGRDKDGDSSVPASPLATPSSPFGQQRGSPSPGRPRPRGESFGSWRERSPSPSSDMDGTGATPIEGTSPPTKLQAPQPTGLASMIRRTSQNVGLSLAARVGGYLPSSVTEMWEPVRDFAWVKTPSSRIRAGSIASAAGGATTVMGGIAAAAGAAAQASGVGSGSGGSGGGAPPVKSVVAMSGGHPQLMVVTSDGQYLVYNVDLERGGEGVLERRNT
jgi:autophagy-related protein 18